LAASDLILHNISFTPFFCGLSVMTGKMRMMTINVNGFDRQLRTLLPTFFLMVEVAVVLDVIWHVPKLGPR